MCAPSFLIAALLAYIRGAACGRWGSELVCNSVAGLTVLQRRICKSNPDLMIALGEGINMAINECQSQFSKHKWDCTNLNKGHSFGYVVVLGSREAAYTYSITSAGVVYSIIASCSRGELQSCGCSFTNKRISRVQTNWKWSGCSVDLTFGLKIARRFLDNRESDGDARSLMNLHNNKAGRNAIKATLIKDCKCHGVSGSCTTRSCWMSLPKFKIVGNHLMRKYWRSKEVKLNSENYLITAGKKNRKPKTAELIYLEQSPNYCEENLTLGIVGTKGRFCNRTKSGLGSCDDLCCGRGYNTHEKIKTWQCNCKFNWCCNVNCEICVEEIEFYTCK